MSAKGNKRGFPDFSRTRFSLSRPLTSYTKVQRAYSSLVRNRRFQLARTGRLGRQYLNVGCGPYPTQGFINLDYHWRPGIDLCWDITKGIPLAANSLQGIYSEHCLEHVDLAESQAALEEFHRLLQPGGVLRLVVPDAELYIDLYRKARDGQHVDFPYAEVLDKQRDFTPMQHVNRVFRDDGHQFAYDYETLRRLLAKAGFSKVSRHSFRDGQHEALLIDNPEREVESLYVEAVKTQAGTGNG